MEGKGSARRAKNQIFFGFSDTLMVDSFPKNMCQSVGSLPFFLYFCHIVHQMHFGHEKRMPLITLPINKHQSKP